MTDLSVVCSKNNITGQVCEILTLHRQTTDQNGSLTCCGMVFVTISIVGYCSGLHCEYTYDCCAPFSYLLLMFWYLLMGFTLPHEMEKEPD